MNDRILFCPKCNDETTLEFYNEIDTSYEDGKYYITTEWYCPKCKKYFLKKDISSVIEYGPLEEEGKEEKKKKKTAFEKEFDDFVWYTPSSW